MPLTDGGPCVGLKKRRKQQGAQVEPALPLRRRGVPQVVPRPHVYPTCKNCYLRIKTIESSGKQAKLGKTEDTPAESGGDIPLESSA